MSLFPRPWPVPIPHWFWAWAAWRHAGRVGPRPADAPTRIPKWAWIRYALLWPKLRGRPVSMATLDPLWNGVVFTAQLNDFDGIRRTGARARGYKVLAILLDGDPSAPRNATALTLYRKTYEAEGWTIVGWGPCYHDPEAGAGRAAQLVHQYGLAGWITNGELWWEGEFIDHSGRFVGEWRRLGAPVPLALSCLSSTTPYYARPMNYAAFTRYGYAIMPQVYGNVEYAYTVRNFTETMERAGVPRALLCPTFGVYGPLKPYADYYTWDGSRGIYLGERVEPPSDYALL